MDFFLNKKGDTIRIENWWEGKKFGSQYVFDHKSKNTKYGFNSLSEEQLFYMVFDSARNVKVIKGIPVYCAFNKNELRIKEPFQLLVYYDVPKQFAYKVSVIEIDKDKKLIYKKIFDQISDEGIDLTYAHKINIEKTYETAGLYIWTCKIKIYNNDASILYDSIRIPVQINTLN